MELVSIATFATKRRKASGSRGEYPMVRFGPARGRGCRALEEAEARLAHERPPVVAQARPDRLRDPGRVAGEELVVLRGAQEAHDAQLDHEVVDDLLGLRLGEAPSARSRAKYTSMKVEVRPSDIAAPFCSFTAAR